MASLELLRNWFEPHRPDLVMYAYALEKGRRFGAYADCELGNRTAGPPGFGGMAFEAVIACHFIEHVSDPHAFLDRAGRRLAPAGASTWKGRGQGRRGFRRARNCWRARWT